MIRNFGIQNGEMIFLKNSQQILILVTSAFATLGMRAVDLWVNVAI